MASRSLRPTCSASSCTTRASAPGRTTIDRRHVIFLASENGALPGGKVGGVADVIRDLPPAVAAEGYDVSVVTPSYGVFHSLDGAKRTGSVTAKFRGKEQRVDVYELPGRDIKQVVLDHPEFTPDAPGQIYHDDGAARPFATDATKFAFLGAAAAAWIESLPEAPSVVHLNDWHAAFYFLERDYGPKADALGGIRTVFSIHNLAYQGQRPFKGDESSLATWFPDREAEREVLADPGAPDALNPMAFAIRSADYVSTVSPSYAREICQSSDPGRGFYGGEGLESDLRRVAADDRLGGILNGIDYPSTHPPRPGWQRLISLMRTQVDDWLERDPANATHQLASERIATLPGRRPLHVMTSIGRLVQQKTSLMLEPAAGKPTALDAILDAVGKHGVLLLVGSGEAEMEAQVFEVAKRHANLVFLNGYSETLAAPLYRGGDLFLMPSSFEPCGISQLLAMREGQPCVVHGVGGLADTVVDGETGFVFRGKNPSEQAEAFVTTVENALELRAERPVSWAGIVQRAERQRYDWSTAARQYIEQVYEPH